ncbi:hypothetical protein EJD97_007298, partial [Solanum chilense]
CQNAAGSTDLAMDRRGHHGPSWTPSSHTCAISSAALFITLDVRYDGSSQAKRSVGGIRSKTLELLEFRYWTTSLIFMMNQQDGPSWLRRTITYSITPHFVRLPHLPSAAALTMPPTDRHEHDGPSQAP